MQGSQSQEHNPCDDYLDTILPEPGQPQPKEEFRAKQLLFTGSQARCLGLYQCSRRCCYCLRLQNIDGCVSLRFPRDVRGAVSLIFEASSTGARGEKCFLWLTGQPSKGHQLY